uniref:Uncharacterized protein n=1 Tax=Trichogramma kaykai TaxID=54128 RepID=A0ABD2VTE8_9HYME
MSRHTPSLPTTPLHVAATGTIDVDLINANSDKMNNEAHTRGVQVSDSTNATASKTLSNPAPLEKKSELPSSSVVDNDMEVIEIDEVAKRVLGDDPTLPTKQKSPVHTHLVVRWKDCLYNGLNSEATDKLIKAYEPIEQFNAQKMNPELIHMLSDKVKKRDAYFVKTQKLAGSALTAIGFAASSLLGKDNVLNREFLIEKLFDAGKIISLLHHGQLIGRKSCIFPLLKKNIRPIVNDLKTDEFVFGHDMMVNVKKLAGDRKQTLIFEETSYRKENNRFLNSNRPLTKPNFVSQVGQKYYKSAPFKKNVFNSKNSKPNSQNTFNQGQNRKH